MKRVATIKRDEGIRGGVVGRCPTVIAVGDARMLYSFTHDRVTQRPLIFEQTSLEEKQPTRADLGIHLAGAALPVERIARSPIAPQRVDVDNSESAIGLLRHHHAHCPPPVMNEVVRIKELLPRPDPAVPIVSSQWHDPLDWVVRGRVRWPGPNRIWMKEGRESAGVPRSPRSRLRINERSDLLFRHVHKLAPLSRQDIHDTRAVNSLSPGVVYAIKTSDGGDAHTRVREHKRAA